MKRLITEITILGVIIIILILMIGKKDTYLEGPNPKDLDSITLINVVSNKGVEKIIINEEGTISNFLNIFSKAKKAEEHSISQFPDKTNFTAVLYKFKSSGGHSLRSIYEEGGSLYIDQPFVGIYKIKANHLNMLDQIIEYGDKEKTSVLINNIFKIDF